MFEAWRLFDYGGLIPHGHCFLWRPELVWLHVISDSLIALSYYSIPTVLGVLVWKRRDTPFHWIFILFAAFIFFCGTSHVFSVITVWKPIYGFEGIIKLITALVSLITAILLFKALPELLVLPGLKEANEKLRVVTDALPVLIGYVDQNKIFRMNNRMYEEWFQVDRSELQGSTVQKVLGDERYAQIGPYIDRALAGETVNYEGQFRTPDGQTRTIDVTYVPQKLNGHVQGFFSLIFDVTDRKREQERLQQAVEASPNAMVMTDQDGRIVMVNARAEEYFGYTREELIGASVDTLLPERFRAGHPILRERFALKPEARPMGSGRDLYGRRKDGSEFPIEIGLNPIETQEGTFVLSAIVDIADRKRMEEAELETERLRVLAETAGAASHEINQPLTSLIGQTDLLMRKQWDDETRRALELISRSGQRISEIVNKMSAPRQYVTKPYTGSTDIVDFEGSSSSEKDDKKDGSA